MTDPSHEFLRAEYEALRAEIVATQRRDFQVIGIGALIIPGVNYIVQSRAQALVVALPAVVVVVVLMHLANTHAITRMGRYIRERIEPVLAGDGGWETWLQGQDVLQESVDTTPPRTRHRRRAENYMRIAVSLVFGLYYIGATWLTYQHSSDVYVSATTIPLVGGYVAIGVWLAFHLWRHLPITTDPRELDPPIVTTPEMARLPIKKQPEPTINA